MPPRAAPTQSPPIPAGLTQSQLLEIYRYLRLTRTLEERLTALYRQSKVIGGLFRSLGQEGESVGSAYALNRGRNQDVLSPLIRNLGSMLVMGAEPVQILRQYMAKAEGRPVCDGEIKPACVQTCPTRALVFGDLMNDAAEVTKLTRLNPRRYHVLEELNTKPAVTYLRRIQVEI